MEQIKILYAEDDATLSFLTIDNLELHNYKITHANCGNEAIDYFNSQDFDICILDVMMPNLDGFEVAKHIRLKNTEIPILFLSAKTLKEDRLKGLRLGADDYLVKPFSIEELILKIEIFVKRSKKSISVSATKLVQVGQFSFDSFNFELEFNNEKTVLTQREAELLLLLIENKNKVLKRDFILEKIWGSNDYFMGRSLDVFISRLRKKLSTDASLSIENLHGIGFKYIEN